MKKIKVLISNDDGIEAAGINALRDILKDDYDVTVVAPSHERSAVSHAISINKSLRCEKIHKCDEFIGYAFEGTPVDCVKFAMTFLMKDNLPDIVISGINRGQNTGNNIIYSGTVAAAIEGAVFGLPAIAVSLNSRSDDRADYHFAAGIVKQLIPQVVENGLPPKTILNVNVPNLQPDAIEGIEITRQSDGLYIDYFVESDEDNGCKLSVRNIGAEIVHSKDIEDADDYALFFRNKVTITPLHFDLTCYHFIDVLKTWFDKK